MRKIKVYCQ